MKTIAFLVAIIISSLSYTPSQYGIIKGKVTDKDTGTPINSAFVTLLKDGNFVKSTKTLKDGTFSLKDIDPDTYSLKFVHKDFIKEIKQSVVINANKSTTINIKLKSIVPLVLAEDDVNEAVVLDEISISNCKVKRDRSKYYKSGSCKPASGSTMSYDGGQTVDWNTESYDKINENIFKEVVNNPLSTFSVDVDRAAYANVRRFLNNNQQPYKDAVRIEEMINYFDYDYPQPKEGQPFSINVEMAKCPWNEEHELLHIGLQGDNMKNQEIPANNLVFLLDVSGSMGSANKLPLLKQAFKILVNNMREEDRIAIVVYAGAAGEVLPSTSGSKKANIIAALDNLNSGGSTAGGAGIKLAYKIAKQNFIEDGNNRIILATDGDFNVGASSNSEMVRLIEEKRDDGIFLTILGFGMGNYKDSKMETISNAGNGNYAYIDNILEAKKVFGKELWGTLYTIAKDVKFQIEFNPSQVKAYRLIGYENRILNKEDFNDDKKDAGDIGCGHTVTALYEIIPADSDENVSNVDKLEYQALKPVSTSKNLMTVKLRYKKPDEDISKLIVNKYKKNEIFRSKTTDNFIFSAAVAEFGMLLRDSKHKANSNFEQTLALAKAAKGADEYGYRNEFINLVQSAELLLK